MTTRHTENIDVKSYIRLRTAIILRSNVLNLSKQSSIIDIFLWNRVNSEMNRDLALTMKRSFYAACNSIFANTVLMDLGPVAPTSLNFKSYLSLELMRWLWCHFKRPTACQFLCMYTFECKTNQRVECLLEYGFSQNISI